MELTGSWVGPTPDISLPPKAMAEIGFRQRPRGSGGDEGSDKRGRGIVL